MKTWAWDGVVAVALALSMVLLLGCEREGPAERAGEKLDRGAEKTGDSLERAGDRTRDRLSR